MKIAALGLAIPLSLTAALATDSPTQPYAPEKDVLLEPGVTRAIELTSHRLYVATDAQIPFLSPKIHGTAFPCGTTLEMMKQQLCPNATLAQATWSGLSAPGGHCGVTFYTLACATISKSNSK